MTAAEWLQDFVKRVAQMQALSTSSELGRDGLWFGGLQSPEAFLIATQQSTAQLLKYSLEELELKFEFDPSDEEISDAISNKTGFIIKGLQIESGEYSSDSKSIKLSSKLESSLPTIILKWVHKETAKKSDEDQGNLRVELPVYLNRSRRNLLCSVKVETGGIAEHVWYQRGVALFAC